MFFDNWAGVGRAALLGVLTYTSVVILLRVTGKRTLSKWNSFDFVVTIALGSTLATSILSNDVSLAEGTTAIAILVLSQYIVTWLSIRSQWLHDLVKDRPSLLLYHGAYQMEMMQRERVAKSEVRAAVRDHGYSSIEKITAVVLETDGKFSVIADAGASDSAFSDVRGLDKAREMRAE